MKKVVIFIAICVSAVTAVEAAISSATAISTEERDVAHKIETSIPVGFAWTVQPPTGAIYLSYIIDTPQKEFSDSISFSETEKDKFSISTADADATIVLTGHEDTQKIGFDGNIPGLGITVNAAGSWFAESTSFPTAVGSGSIDIKMATSALLNPIDPPPSWVGFSAAAVKDPFPFPAISPGESLRLDTTMYAGQLLKATGDGVASKQLFVGTDIPGYEMLYQLDVEAREINGAPALSVDFISHAAMGLDNEAVANAVFNAFTLNPVEQQFELGSDLTVFDGPLPLPTGQAFNLHLDETTSAQVEPTVVPPDLSSVILSPVAISETGLGSEFGTPLENMMNRSGFTEPFVSGETSFDEYVDVDSGKSLANGRFENIWSSRLLPNGEPDGELIFDFGETQAIDRLAVWNATLKDIGVYVADSPDGPWQEVGDFTLDSKVGTESAYYPDIVDFQDTFDAQYVRIDVDSLYRPSDDSAWFAVVGEVAASVRPASPALLGDFNLNGLLDSDDIDQLTAHIRQAGSDAIFDVNFDGAVDKSDLDVWVRDLKNSYYGDANLDGEFSSGDLVDVFVADEYEDDIALNSTWAEGDFNGDGEFESGDLVAAFVDAGYEQGPRTATHAVPEPSALVALLVGVIGIAGQRAGRRN